MLGRDDLAVWPLGSLVLGRRMHRYYRHVRCMQHDSRRMLPSSLQFALLDLESGPSILRVRVQSSRLMVNMVIVNACLVPIQVIKNAELA